MNPNQSSMPVGVTALAISAFAIGSSEFIVVGILPAIAADLGIALDTAGSLVSLYALALVLGTPLLVLALSRWPRKRVLAGLIAVFLAGNLLSALSSSFNMLLFARMLTAVAHGCFFAIGATVAAALVSPQHGARRHGVVAVGRLGRGDRGPAAAGVAGGPTPPSGPHRRHTHPTFLGHACSHLHHAPTPRCRDTRAPSNRTA